MKIIPLDLEFCRAKVLLPTDAQLIQSVAESVDRRFPSAKMEWDEGAGDTWIMINQNGMNLAMLNSTIPLLFIHPTIAEEIRLAPDRARVVVEENFTSCHFSVMPHTVLNVLNLIWPVNEVDPTQFSLADLSWATI